MSGNKLKCAFPTFANFLSVLIFDNIPHKCGTPKGEDFWGMPYLCGILVVEKIYMGIAEIVKMNKLYGSMSIDLKIKSIGWCLNDSAGGSPGDSFAISLENRLGKSDIFCKPFKNFGRLDGMSKAVCTAVAFVLRGAGLYPKDEKQPISIYFSNKEGSLNSDTAYFKDFVDYDETAGRANLFLYTLPSSPLGEASVHFGLTGDVAYLADSGNQLKAMLKTAEDACAFRRSPSDTKQFLIGMGSFSSLRSPIVNSSRIGRSANSKDIDQLHLDDSKLPENDCFLRSENANYQEATAEAVFLLVSNEDRGINKSDIILNKMPDFTQLKTMILSEIK